MSGEPDDETTFRLIPDTAIEDEAEDRFGHSVFADWLVSALESANKPINIGLFGRWGTGKTGILRVLKKKLKSKHGKRYKYCYIDCWRISPDHIRHQLLIDLNDILCGLSRNELVRQLFYTTEKPDLVDSAKKFARSAGELIKSLYVPGAFAMGILGVLIAVDPIWPDTNMLSILGPVFLVPFITQLAVKLSNSNDRIIQTITKVIPPINSHAGFQKIFKKIISKHRKKRRKIVIALDNLDRCDGDVAIEILAIVKSFMERPAVFFIIPCDTTAIVKYLKNKRNFDDKDGDMAEDFLRKFFQVSVTIPPLIHSSMADYVDRLVRQYDIHNVNDDVRTVISIASMDNPRRIKQFLNNYVANYHLAMRIEKERYLPEGTITHERGFLAKILVLQDIYPDFYKELVNENKLLEYVVDNLDDKKTPDYSEMRIKSIIKAGGLKRFLNLTRDIKVNDIKPFIKLAQDPHEKSPMYGEIRYKMGENDHGGINEIIRSDPSNINELLKIIESIVDLDLAKGHLRFGIYGLNIILHAYEAAPDSHKNKLIELFGRYAKSENILDNTIFDLKTVFKFIDKMEEGDNRNVILEKYCRLFYKPNNYNEMLLELLIAHVHIFTDAAKNSFKEHMVKFYNTKESLAISVINGNFKNEHVAELLDNKIIEAIINKMTNRLSKEDQDRIKTYLQIKQVSSDDSKFKFVACLFGMMEPDLHPAQLHNKMNFVMMVLEQLDHSDVTESAVYIIYKILLYCDDHLSDEDQKITIFELIIKHFDKLSMDYKTNFINNKLQNCFNRSDNELARILYAMDLSKESFLNYDKIFDAMFNVVSNNANPFVFNYLIKNSMGDQRDKVLDLIDSCIKDSDESKRRQVCSVIEKARKNLKEIDRFVPSIINALNNPNYSSKNEMLNALAIIFVKCSLTRDNIIQEFVKWIKDPTYGVNAKNCFDTIQPHLDDSQKLLIWNEMISSLSNNFNNGTLSILDLLVDKERINNDNYQSVVNILITQIDQANMIVLEYMIKIKKMFGLDEATTKKILDMTEDNDRIRKLKQQFKNQEAEDNNQDSVQSSESD